MKTLLTTAATLAILTAPALAQLSTSQTQSGSQTNTTTSQDDLAAAQKLKQDLQNAGFTDVKVVAESFVVQAKSKDGNPVLMTIGPHGMSVFEAMNSDSNNSTTTGSSNSTSGAASASSGTGGPAPVGTKGTSSSDSDQGATNAPGARHKMTPP